MLSRGVESGTCRLVFDGLLGLLHFAWDGRRPTKQTRSPFDKQFPLLLPYSSTIMQSFLYLHKARSCRTLSNNKHSLLVPFASLQRLTHSSDFHCGLK